MSKGGVIGVYDMDFMSHQNVIPNLECGKMVMWHRNQHRMAGLAPVLEPNLYSNFILRKEYDDGNFPKVIFQDRCDYGGRVFTDGEYIPYEREVETIIPDMTIYDKFKDGFGDSKSSQELFQRIINSAHLRLAPFGEIEEEYILTLKKELELKQREFRGIILHDYDLGSVKGSVEALRLLTNSREYVAKEGIRPFPVGNKYPIKIRTIDELKDWLSIPIMDKVLFIQYDGLMEPEFLKYIAENHYKFGLQLYYNPTKGCNSEKELIQNLLPEVYKQICFLRLIGLKVLLYYEDLETNIEIKNFLNLINCWLRFSYVDDLPPGYQTLFGFCRSYKVLQYKSWAFQKVVNVSTAESREVFYYFREKNYKLFKMFYEWDKVKLEGGKITQDENWRRDKKSN